MSLSGDSHLSRRVAIEFVGTICIRFCIIYAGKSGSVDDGGGFDFPDIVFHSPRVEKVNFIATCAVKRYLSRFGNTRQSAG